MLKTEMRNEHTTHIDRMETAEMLRVIQNENLNAARAVESELPAIGAAVDAITERMNKAFAERVCTLAEGAIFGIGAICLVWLICRKRTEPDFSQGCFEKTMPLSPEYVPYELERPRKVKLFFSPLMITFLALCASTMVTYFIMALVMYGK